MGQCYVMGPMTGHPDENWPAFDAAQEQLESEGWEVKTPPSINREHGFHTSGGRTPDELQMLMRSDVLAVLVSDAVFALPGWQYSAGSAVEYKVAESCGIPMFEFSNRAQILPGQFKPLRMYLLYNGAEDLRTLPNLSNQEPHLNLIGDPNDA